MEESQETLYDASINIEAWFVMSLHSFVSVILNFGKARDWIVDAV